MRADLVCGVGCSFTKTNFAVPIPPGKRLVHLTNDEDAINKDYRCDFPVLEDAKLVLQQLLAALHAGGGSAGGGHGLARDPGHQGGLAGAVDAQTHRHGHAD